METGKCDLESELRALPAQNSITLAICKSKYILMCNVYVSIDLHISSTKKFIINFSYG